MRVPRGSYLGPNCSASCFGMLGTTQKLQHLQSKRNITRPGKQLFDHHKHALTPRKEMACADWYAAASPLTTIES